MLPISKSTKKVLQAFRTQQPNLQGRFFVTDRMTFPADLTSDDIRAGIARLVDVGALAVPPNGSGIYTVTDIGMNWFEYAHNAKLDTFLKSILCPIVVTLLTEAVLHGLPILLKLIQALAESTP